MEKYDIHKLKFNITLVSEMTGLSPSVIRYWEKSFADYLKPKRKGIDNSRMATRMYTLNDIEIILTIKKLKEEDYLTTKGIRARLKSFYSAEEVKAEGSPSGYQQQIRG